MILIRTKKPVGNKKIGIVAATEHYRISRGRDFSRETLQDEQIIANELVKKFYPNYKRVYHLSKIGNEHFWITEKE